MLGASPEPGGWADADSGLMLLGHRYYDASIGRLISRDPAYAGTNYYAYCENNPLGGTDPSGLFAGVGVGLIGSGGSLLPALGVVAIIAVVVIVAILAINYYVDRRAIAAPAPGISTPSPTAPVNTASEASWVRGAPVGQEPSWEGGRGGLKKDGELQDDGRVIFKPGYAPSVTTTPEFLLKGIPVGWEIGQLPPELNVVPRGRTGNPGHGQVEPREGEIDIEEMRRLLPEFKGKQ